MRRLQYIAIGGDIPATPSAGMSPPFLFPYPASRCSIPPRNFCQASPTLLWQSSASHPSTRKKIDPRDRSAVKSLSGKAQTLPLPDLCHLILVSCNVCNQGKRSPKPRKPASTLLAGFLIYKYICVCFVTNTLQQPGPRLTEADYQHITEIWETSGKHYEHELHILHTLFLHVLRHP